MSAPHIPPFRLQFRQPEQSLKGPIRHTVSHCSLGHLLVAHSQDGVCAIFIGDDVSALLQSLQQALPNAELAPAGHEANDDISIITRVVDGLPSTSARMVTLDIGGTAFQQQVWQALLAIPVGQTRSYSDMAKTLGIPKAYRAVGSACAANLLAIAIPCHRALRSDGQLSGYRWGLARKQLLLERERSAA